MSREGIDYSSTAGINSPSVGTLKAQGKSFVGRYAVNDKSPAGRGIDAAEYQRWKAGDIDVFLYWESSESWMLGGWNAGVVAANNAQYNINDAGIPGETPVYFACDWDASSAYELTQIDACLRGAASVLGANRVGVYGGYTVIEHCAKTKSAVWFCQTYAWEYGRGLHPSAQLYQYDNNGNYFDGTDSDLVRATVENFGQASVAEKPTDPKPTVSWGPLATKPMQYKGALVRPLHAHLTAARHVPIRLVANAKGKVVHTMNAGDEAICRGTMKSGNVAWVFVQWDNDATKVGRARASAFKERYPLPS